MNKNLVRKINYFLFCVGRYIEQEYDPKIGETIQAMYNNTMPVMIFDFIAAKYLSKSNIPNTAYELYHLLKDQQDV